MYARFKNMDWQKISGTNKIWLDKLYKIENQCRFTGDYPINYPYLDQCTKSR